MRMLLTFMAVMVMFVSPALAGAKAGCPVDGSRTIHCLSMTAMAASMTSAAQPCCDPGSKSKSMPKGCAQICASLGVVAVTAAPVAVDAPSTFATLVMTTPNAAPLRAFEPLGLKRPPKSIA
jgi:hypothetical protein